MSILPAPRTLIPERGAVALAVLVPRLRCRCTPPIGGPRRLVSFTYSGSDLLIRRAWISSGTR
jgi:hypothetical protein